MQGMKLFVLFIFQLFVVGILRIYKMYSFIIKEEGILEK